MRALTELAKRRGYFFQSSEAYGGVAGFYTYGPQGAALKERVEDTWRERFSVAEGHMEVDAPTVMPEPVFEASGHLDGFDDMLVECAECGTSHRADHLVEGATDVEEAESLPPEEVAALLDAHDVVCPNCGAPLAGQPVDEFNLMFETNIGPGSSQTGYLRPETAQGIFVEFPRLKEYARGQLPFGVTQIGKSYRNEISPRNALVRTREFTQAELELFVDPDGDDPDVDSVADVELTLYPAENQPDGDYVETTVAAAVDRGLVEPWVAYYLGVATEWYADIGVDFERFRYRQHQAGERAHYASDCWDAEADVSAPGEDPEWIEIAGYAYRGDYDLSKHDAHSSESFTVFKQYDEPKTVERASVDPDMSYLGPEYGGDAAAIADELEALARRDRAAFDGETVAVEVDDETYELPVEKTGFEVAEETEAGHHVTPHVVEPSIGIDRTVYTVLAHAYDEDEVDEGERTVLRLDAGVAPTNVAVFPLMDKDGMGDLARDVVDDLRGEGYAVTFDTSGNIGRRYRRQDEIGTPFCVTVDYESVEEDPETVTVRERDSTAQARVATAELAETLAGLRDGGLAFDDL